MNVNNHPVKVTLVDTDDSTFYANSHPIKVAIEGGGSFDNLQKEIDQEVSDRKEADEQLKKDITNAVAVESNNRTQEIEKEATTREVADEDLSDRIDAEAQTRESAVNTLTSHIDEHESRISANEKQIETNTQDITEALGSIAELGADKLDIDNLKSGKSVEVTKDVATSSLTVNVLVDDHMDTQSENPVANKALKTYIDEKASTAESQALEEAKSYSDNNVSSVREYIDTQDATTEANANKYTDEHITAAREEAKVVNEAYTNTKVSDALAEAKGYTDTEVESAKTTLQEYADGHITTAVMTNREYTDSHISDAKDEVLAGAKDYTDGKIATATSGSQAYTDGEIDKIENTINKTVVKDVALGGDTSTTTVVLKNAKTNILSGEETTTTLSLPVASATEAGVMNAATFKSLEDLKAGVNAIAHEAVAVQGVITDQSRQDEITAAWKEASSSGYEEPIPGASIFDTENLVMYRYYDNTKTWELIQDGLAAEIKIGTFTNANAGLIKGSTEPGQIFAEGNGSGSVNGWDTTQGKISDLESEMPTKQDKIVAGTNITIADDGVTISATDTKYENATVEKAGLMSAEDKTQLTTNTSNIAKNTTAIAGKQDKLTAGDNITIVNGKISAKDTNTTYTAGAGLELNGTEFSLDETNHITPTEVDSKISTALVVMRNHLILQLPLVASKTRLKPELVSLLPLMGLLFQAKLTPMQLQVPLV